MICEAGLTNRLKIELNFVIKLNVLAQIVLNHILFESNDFFNF